MKRGDLSLRRLRWKLTLSYALVTVVALLAVELALFSVLLLFVHSGQLAGSLADDAESRLAPRLEPKLAGEPPDLEGMRDELRDFRSPPGSGVEDSGAGNFGVSYGDPEATSLFVVDDEGKLLVLYPTRGGFSEGFSEGERFDAGRFAGLPPLLDAALDGKEDAGPRSGNEGDRMLAVVPLEDDEGRVSGTLVSVARMPLFGELVVRLLPVAGVSVAVLAVPAAIVGTIFGFVTAWGLTRRLGRLVRAKELLAESQKELNVLIRGMRPAALEDEGLAVALRNHAAMWSRASGVEAEVRVEGEREAPLEVEQTLFRVAQEALANIARHSGARHAEISLVYDEDLLTLRVSDDGWGFDLAQTSGGGFGLRGMRERAAGIGGLCDIESAPGGGTRVVCACPPGGAGTEGKKA